MKLSDLAPNPQNPRKISDDQKKRLKKSLETFGDLSGIIFNRTTGRLVGGHQRQKSLPPDAEIVRKELAEATPTGTIAIGHILLPNGEKLAYRETAWSESTEKAAALAANQHGGEWDYPLLIDHLIDLDNNNIDLDLTGFSTEEIENLLAPEKEPKKKLVTCPQCGTEFDSKAKSKKAD